MVQDLCILYVCQGLHFDLIRYVALFLNIYFKYDLCINTEFGQGSPIFKSLEQRLNFFIHFDLIHMAWGPMFEPQCLHFIFTLISLFSFRLIELRGCVIEPLQSHLLFNFVAFKFHSFGRGVVLSNTTAPL